MGNTRESTLAALNSRVMVLIAFPGEVQIRCEEVDWKTSWKWALPVFDLEIYAARRAEAGSSTQGRRSESEEVVDVWARKEKYLRRLLVSVSLIHVSTPRIPACVPCSDVRGSRSVPRFS